MAEEVPLPSSVATFQPVNHLNLLQKRVICILRKRVVPSRVGGRELEHRGGTAWWWWC
ncbi:hypothetical protein Bca4012_058564 [Brassica carinata]